MRIHSFFIVAAFAFMIFLVQPSYSDQKDTGNEPAVESTPLYHFHSNAWLNLHHFLYQWALSASPIASPDKRFSVQFSEMSDLSKLSPEEQRTWNEVLQHYKSNIIQRDLLFDDELVELKRRLADLGQAVPLPDDLPLTMQAQFSRAMPIYRKYWWPDHDQHNRQWIASLVRTLTRFEKPVAERLSRALGGAWPDEPLRVDVAPYAHPAGAYTTKDPVHIMISSRASEGEDPVSLETVWHESCHTEFLARPLITGINQAFQSLKQNPPPGLWHTLLFYTAGEITREVLKENGDPNYVPFAERRGLYERQPWLQYRKAFDESWKPFLQGKTDQSSALAGIAKQLSRAPSE